MVLISGADPANTGSSRTDKLIDDYLDGILEEFRQLQVWDEQARRTTTDPMTLAITYRPINTGFTPEIYDGQNRIVPPLNTTVSLADGTFSVSTDDGQQDYFVTYRFNYFPADLLQQFLKVSLLEINATATAATYVTSYDSIDAAPAYFDGPLVVGALAKAYQRLATDSMIWKNFLIWQDGNRAQEIAGQAAQYYNGLYTELRTGAKFGKFIAKPSEYYALFRVSGFGGINQYSGKFRGLQLNQMNAFVGLDGNVS